MDLFLVHAYHDEDFASGLEDTLSCRGLFVGEPLSLWPGQQLLPQIDARLFEARFALLIVSRDFLKFSWPRKELDGLTTRRNVVSLLSGTTEAEVAGYSPRLAVAALPASATEKLVRLFRSQEDG